MSDESAPMTDTSNQTDGDPQPLTDAQLAEAKKYNQRELACDLGDRGLDLAYLAIMTFMFARPIDTWLQSFPALSTLTARLAVMYLIVTGIHILVSFPLSFYSGHVIEHQFQMSRQTLGAWFWRYMKRNGLTLAFGLLLTQGLFWMIWLTGPIWWLVAAAGYFVLSIVMGQLAPVLILPLFYKIEPLDDETLKQRMAKLSEGTGLSIEGVYRMKMSDETVKANAMLAGLGNTRRVIMGDTLLEGFSADEIEVIFAHEIGHHVHRHLRKMIITGLIYSTAGFFLCDRMLAWWVGSVDGTVDYAQLPVYTLPFLTLVITVFSMFVEPIQNLVSRYFEVQSDTYALTKTGLHDAYRSAFTKLARLNKADPDPHPLEVFLFHSHPPIKDRLALADRV
ncbi:MAG: M48 family metallopeptidase [Planctomycetaceae bacterium]|nr:M48 family metallopeptidase [Planctomycetaceae bacterium]